MADKSVTVTKTGVNTYSWSANKIELTDGQTVEVIKGAGFDASSKIDAVKFYTSSAKAQAGPPFGSWTRGDGDSGTSSGLDGVVSVQANSSTKVTLKDLWSDTSEDDDIWFTVTIGPDKPDPELVLKKQTSSEGAAGA